MKSITNRVLDLLIDDKSFINDNGEKVEYKVLVIRVKLGDTEEEIVTSIKPDKAKLIMASKVLTDTDLKLFPDEDTK